MVIDGRFAFDFIVNKTFCWLSEDRTRDTYVPIVRSRPRYWRYLGTYLNLITKWNMLQYSRKWIEKRLIWPLKVACARYTFGYQFGTIPCSRVRADIHVINDDDGIDTRIRYSYDRKYDFGQPIRLSGKGWQSIIIIITIKTITIPIWCASWTVNIRWMRSK